MSLSPCPTFDVVIDTFLRDRSSPSPVLEELHPGHRTERDALSTAFRSISELYRLAGDAEPSSQITADMLIGAVRETVNFIQSQRASSSHVWSSNIFSTFVIKMAFPHRNGLCKMHCSGSIVSLRRGKSY